MISIYLIFLSNLYTNKNDKYLKNVTFCPINLEFCSK